MDVERKMELLGELYDEWSKCDRCGLCDPPGRRRHNVVFGEGNPDADLMIIGEAPDEKDDITGQPFAGRAGEIVDMFLESFNSNRNEVFITHMVGCRPTEADKPGWNRAPNKDELAACSPRVHRLIEVVDPYVILLLGNTAFKALSPEKGGVKAVATNDQIPDIRAVSPGRFMPVERTAYATWHPMYLARNWDQRVGGPVYQSFITWEKAFRVADKFAELYRGQTPPSRESNGR